ncbi:MAG TPA: transcription antitermination factor NusB [Gammaproteobacteria bacterium]|jgi:N utilization substance protein B|nr:transcription antitermination factor NusB [Acidiferrobacteraceae bacterium]MBF40015.1 transcription antitermination factor NusB [Acidiferrobacteraceae bacterium]HAU10265.1 transcription antitermination factor NusB [Gammaproteobacteria bacterium]HIC24541.1 transcription antitermination factor NusB [Gammaproteobacteria bacterium]HIM71124.1 transcription antitermination factor NusB [Gammaproteobacteria bacterium]|tara:strand:+ start:2071 stop:2478 length:408 start_codon:yes stop_codon:yes gene_type:complete
MARRRAVQALYQGEIMDQSVNEIKLNFLEDSKQAEVDYAYFYHLLEEVSNHRDSIDARLAGCLDRDLAMVDPVERAVLRLGAYELEYQTDTPTRVVLDESIEMSRIFGAEEAYRFVNGVLDRLATVLGRKTGSDV